MVSPVKIISRKLKLWEALIFSVGLVGPTLAMSGNAQGIIASVGKALPMVFILGFVGVLFIAYGFIRLTAYYSHTGSAYGLVGVTIGPRSGFFSGFALFGAYLFSAVSALAAFGAFTNAFLAALTPRSSHPFQLPWIILVFVGVLLSLYLNNKNGRYIARVLVIIEGIGIVLMLILAAVILMKGGAHPATPRPSLLALHGVGVKAVMGGVVAAFLSWAGFEGCATLGEETDKPKRNIPLALLGSIVLTGILFVLMMYAQLIGFGANPAGFKNFANSSNSLGTLAGQYIGDVFGLCILFTALMSAFACHLSSTAAAGRLTYALARDGFGHRILAQLHEKTNSPRNAIILVLIVCIVINFLSWLSGKPDMGTGSAALNSYFYYAIVGSICMMITYLMVEIGVIGLILRGQIKIPLWELILPVLGIAIMVISIYFNLLGQGNILSPPVIGLIWVGVGLAIILLVPKLARRIGGMLTEEFTKNNPPQGEKMIDL